MNQNDNSPPGQPDSLAWLTSEELIEELLSRHSSAVFGGIDIKSTASILRGAGSMISQLGLVEALRHTIADRYMEESGPGVEEA